MKNVITYVEDFTQWYDAKRQISLPLSLGLFDLLSFCRSVGWEIFINLCNCLSVSPLSLSLNHALPSPLSLYLSHSLCLCLYFARFLSFWLAAHRSLCLCNYLYLILLSTCSSFSLSPISTPPYLSLLSTSSSLSLCLFHRLLHHIIESFPPNHLVHTSPLRLCLQNSSTNQLFTPIFSPLLQVSSTPTSVQSGGPSTSPRGTHSSMWRPISTPRASRWASPPSTPPRQPQPKSGMATSPVSCSIFSGVSRQRAWQGLVGQVRGGTRHRLMVGQVRGGTRHRLTVGQVEQQ